MTSPSHLFRRAAAALFFCLGAAPVARAADPSGPVVVWAMGEEGKKIAEMARRFEALNPGMKVETQAIPWEAAHAKLLTSVVGGIPPDVSQMGTTWMAEFAAMGAFTPLDDRAATSVEASTGAFFAGSLQTCVVDGKLYGLPWYVDTRVLFFRKDLLAQAGFKDGPRTWDELKEACRRLKDIPLPGGKKRFGLSLGTRSWTDFLPFAWQNEADPLHPSSPAFLEAMNYYVDFFDRGYSPTKEAADVELLNAFKSGALPMFISGPWMVELTRKEMPDMDGRWALAVLPKKVRRTSFVGGSNLVLFKDSKRKDAAWKFMEFMSAPENQVAWYKVTADLPSAKKAWGTDVFMADPFIRVFGEQMNDTASPPNIPAWEQVSHALENTLEKVILKDGGGDGDVQARLLALEKEMLAFTNPQKDRKGSWRSILLFLLLIAFIVALAWTFLPFNLLRGAPAGGKPPKQDGDREDGSVSYVGVAFVSPAIALLGLFLFLPIAVAFLMSLTDLNVFNVNQWSGIHFVAWDNYLRVFDDPVFWKSLWNTLYFAGFGVPLTIGVSLLAAVSLNQKYLRGKAAFRLSMFTPVVTTVVAVAVVWRWIYNPEFGPLNWILQCMGFRPLHWLADAKTALPSLIIMAVWKNFGYNMVIFLAGLQTIPESQYEAAHIDGANGWQCFRYITLPGLAPTTLFVVVLTTIGYLQFFAEPYVMTKGGPLDSTMSIVLYMYNQGFRFFNLGYASAVSYILFAMIFCCTLLQLRLKKSSAMDA